MIMVQRSIGNQTAMLILATLMQRGRNVQRAKQVIRRVQ